MLRLFFCAQPRLPRTYYEYARNGRNALAALISLGENDSSRLNARAYYDLLVMGAKIFSARTEGSGGRQIADGSPALAEKKR